MLYDRLDASPTALSTKGSAHHTGCGCGCAPGEFVRLRYYYGQLMGATDMSDEQDYLVAKHRFHNVWLHGWGVVCGLGVDRVAPPAPGGPSTSLRVRRGIAIDRCGNEIVIPGDYCIDVNAWFLVNKTTAAKNLGTGAGGTPPAAGAPRTDVVYVVVRYLECPSEPAIAPRDPCGCDAGGCEFARVRETFRLDVITADQLKDAPQDPPFPFGAEFEGLGALTDVTEASLHRATSALCPAASKGQWLVIAAVSVTLDPGRTKVTDIGQPDITTPLRRVLLSTAAMQRALAATSANLGLAERGPSVQSVKLGQNPATLLVPLRLLAPDAPIDNVTLSNASISVFNFVPGAGWTALPFAASPALLPSNDVIEIGLNAPLAAGDTIRVTLEQDPATPICDLKGRSLLPMTFAHTYSVQLDAQSGNLALAELPH